MDLPLEFPAELSSTFTLSPPIPLALYMATKPTFDDSILKSLLSLAGAVALVVLTNKIEVQRNPIFGNGVGSLLKASSPLQEPTATLIPSATPSLACSGSGSEIQAFAVLATICATLVGSAFVMYLSGMSSRKFCSSSSEPARNRDQGSQQFARQASPRSPASWPPPPPPRPPSGNQPLNRTSSSMEGNTQHGQLIRRPNRDDPPPPPPPPPSLAGFIQDFPLPETFEEWLAMNLIFGALSGWMLRKLIRHFRNRRALQKTRDISPSLERQVARPTPRKTCARSRPTPTRSRLPERRQSPVPFPLQSSVHPFSILLISILVSSGSIIVIGLEVRRRVANGDLPMESNLLYTVHYEPCSPADTSYVDKIPSPQTTLSLADRRLSTTRRKSDDLVRLSKINQVKYFYKDEIIGFKSGPPPRSREALRRSDHN